MGGAPLQPTGSEQRKALRKGAGSKTKKVLQNAALRLLDHHQDVNKLLQEMQGETQKPLQSYQQDEGRSDVALTGSPAQFSMHGNISPDGDEFQAGAIVSCLRQQAELSGMPVSLLAAKKCAEFLNTVAGSNQLPGDSHVIHGLLTLEAKTKVDQILSLINSLTEQKIFHRGRFAEELNSLTNKQGLPLELLWHLHRESLMTFDLYLTSHIKHQAVLDGLAGDIASVWEGSWERGADAEKCDFLHQMTIDTLICFIQLVHREKIAHSSSSDVPEVRGICESAERILEQVFARVFWAACKQCGEPPSHEDVLPMSRLQTLLPTESCRLFASRHITQLFSHTTGSSVTDTFGQQHEWTFAKASPYVVSLFRQLLLALHESDAVGLLRRALEQDQVNWKSALIYTSTGLIYFPEAQELIRSCIQEFVEQALESYEEGPLISAFLLVRQAANEGPHVFPPYASWFKETFSSGPSSTNKKAFSFLLEFLTNLVPHEMASSLRAHIQNPPTAPAKCQDILRDYLMLAKTRLSDLNPRDQALMDVDVAVDSFENNGRIPPNVLEASIFKKPYYVAHFLPALLTPRMLPDIADGKMKLIEAMKSANKIPSSLYRQYEEACAKELNELLDGAFSEDALEDCMEPQEALQVGLQKLQTCVTAGGGGEGELTAQMTLLADRIAVAMGLDAPPPQPATNACGTTPIDISNCKHSPALQQVAEVILDAFSSICSKLAVLNQNPTEPTAKFVDMGWARQAVRMLSRFTDLCSALYHRVWTSVCQQDSSTSGDTLTGLACFLVCLQLEKALLPPVLPSNGRSMQSVRRSIKAAINQHFVTDAIYCKVTSLVRVTSLELRLADDSVMLRCISASVGWWATGEEGVAWLSAVSFTSVILHLFLITRKCNNPEQMATSSLEGDIPQALLDKFCFIMPRVHSVLRESSDYAVDLCLQEGTFLAFLTAYTFQLSLTKWIACELCVLPHEDYLNDSERHDFHQWALLCHFLPHPKTQGGCQGSHRQVCEDLVHGLLDHQTRAMGVATHNEVNPQDGTSAGSSEADLLEPHPAPCPPWYPHGNQHTCWRELLQMLQELIPMIGLDDAPTHVSGGEEDKSHDIWLLGVLNKRLDSVTSKGTSDSASSGVCFPLEAIEVQSFTRLMCCLPPYLIFSSHPGKVPSESSLQKLSTFINQLLRRHCVEAWGSLPYLITAHLVKGVMLVSRQTSDALLRSFLVSCPILVSSILVHWSRLWPFIMHGYGQKPAPEVFQQFRDLFNSAQGIVKKGRSIHKRTSASSSTLSTSSSLLKSMALGVRTDVGVSTATPPWLRAVAIHKAVMQQCRPEDRSATLDAVLHLVSKDRQEQQSISVGLIECLIADKAWGMVEGQTKRWDHPTTTHLITKNIPFLLQALSDLRGLPKGVVSESASSLYPVVILRSFLEVKGQMQSLLSQHPQLMATLLQSHNAMRELYCRVGVEQPQPTPGIRKHVRLDEGEVLTTELMLSCTRLLHHCISFCPSSALRSIRRETLAGSLEELRAAVWKRLRESR
ncbi:Fanconi anemia group A protein-like [Diadema setosum]|uniref:Fanconi anemia group A protein-like n=1 Tax=Diadema setosum TaxID=31175 RepID=UPI003B3BB05C